MGFRREPAVSLKPAGHAVCLALLNRAVRLLQYKMGAVEKDIALLSEEIKLLSSGRKMSVDLSDWAEEEGLAAGGPKTERK